MNWASERVALLYGGFGSEADVSRDGKVTVVAAMRELGIKPLELDIKDGLLEPLMAANPTRVFNLVHGRPGKTAYYRDCYVRSVSRSQAQASELQR